MDRIINFEEILRDRQEILVRIARLEEKIGNQERKIELLLRFMNEFIDSEHAQKRKKVSRYLIHPN